MKTQIKWMRKVIVDLPNVVARGSLLLIAAAIATLAVTVQSAAQQVNEPNPATTPVVKIKHTPIKWVPVNSGQQMYASYCAACHGATGIGDGPAAPALTAKPADLTVLSARNNGRFPALRVRQILTTEDRHLNGSTEMTEMPNWYPALRSLNRDNYGEVMQRAHNLVHYLQSLQVQDTLQAKAR